MKKKWKKILAVVLLFTMIFTFSVRPKKADASISMTLAALASTLGTAGATATAVTMLPYALGAAGILAVGGVIKNWDTVKEYGEEVIARMGGYDAASGSYVQNPDGTATVIYSPAMKLAMAQAVDYVPAQILPPTSFVSLGTVTDWNYKTVTGLSIDISNYKGNLITVDSTYKGASNTGYYLTITRSTDGGAFESVIQQFDYVGVVNGKYRFQYRFPDVSYYEYGKLIGYQWNLFDGATTTQHTANLSYALGELGAGVPIDTADTFGMVADNVNARLLNMNAAIADNQSITYSADAELLNASIDDLATISNAQLSEAQTQTGLLSQIWRAILSVITAINSVSTNVSSAVNAKMQELWDDAGAIWSGMGDTLTNIQTDVNAKIGAMQDTLTGGIDNIRTDIGAMVDNLRAGIDSFAASAAANWASWGQLTLDGIDAGVGVITGAITDTWTATTTTINEGIGTITDGLTSIIDWITGFPTMFYSWFVPPDFSFIGPLITKATDDLENKVGTLPKIEDLTAAISTYEKSIYDIEITLMGKNYKIVPIALKPTIDWARPFLTAAVNLTSITFLIHRNKRELFK